MIVFASTLRIARRPRRFPSVASLVRVLGTVRVSDHPDFRSACSAPAEPYPSRAAVTQIHGSRRPPGGAPRSS
jgi:hypothetical protein